MIPKRIFLCGGGVNVVTHIGVLKELHRKSMLRAVREWMGVSAGALMALCIAIGYTFEELEQIYMKFDFRNIADLDSAPGWIINYGMDTGNKLRKLVEACLHIKGLSETITFQEVHEKFKISFRVFATDLQLAKLITFSEVVTPTRSVVEAVTASMSIPYYFQPVIDSINSHFLMDGAVISNYPLFMLSEVELRDTLGIYLRTGPAPVEELQVQDFAFRPLQIVLSSRGKFEISQYENQTILIDIGSRNSLHLEISEKEKLELIGMGRAAVQQYMMKSLKRITRRYSVG